MIIYHTLLAHSLSEYGGSLAALSQLENPLDKFAVPSHSSNPPASSSTSVRLELRPSEAITRVPSISPTSHLNPYFGYPVSGRDAITPRLRYGRQRKRDLLRTLACLWWSRWKHRVYLLLGVLLAVVMATPRRRPRVLRWKQTLRRLLASPSQAQGSR